MRLLCLLACLILFSASVTRGQDTFSIVAVDTLTGEIGSAGASCVGAISGVGAFILSDVLEGVGAIHTQASYLAQNQMNARARMLAGDTPQQIIAWLTANDAQGNPAVRQYGIVDLRRRGESAAYTAVNCLDYKNHATGPGYAVQGNILLGQVIIDTMKNTFLRTRGPLADRLMATLEAAKIIGADTRCASRNTSSQSGFIKVVRIGDGNVPYLQKVVPTTSVGVDPITVLRSQFNQWKDSLRARPDPFLSTMTVSPETLRADGASTATILISPRNNSDSLLAPGRIILIARSGSGSLSGVMDLGNGTYSATLTAPLQVGSDTISARVVAGTDTIRLAQRRIVRYTSPSSATFAGSGVPVRLELLPPTPNPFNPSAEILFGLPEAGPTLLQVFDLLGRHMVTLLDGYRGAGYHSVHLDAADWPSGVYIVTLKTADALQSRKVTLLR